MKSTFVYRIENSSGVGPYLFSNLRQEQWSRRTHTGCNHPDLFQDIEDLPDDDKIHHYLCGFKDLHSLNQWFNQYELTNLYSLGFSVKKIKAIHVIHGRKQVLFRPKESSKKIALSLKKVIKSECRFNSNFQYDVKMLALGRIMDKLSPSSLLKIKQNHNSLLLDCDYKKTAFFRFLNEYYSDKPNLKIKNKAISEICSLVE